MEIILNRRFLYKMRPERMILIAVLFWLVCLVFSPITPVSGLTIEAFLYLSLCLLFFGIGTMSVKHKKKVNTIIEVDTSRLNRIYYVTLALGSIGVALKIYDVLFIRDASLLFSDEASLEIAEGGTLFSIISGMLIFFSYIPITIDSLCPLLHKLLVKIISFLIFLGTGISAVVSGSRFAIVLPLFYFLFLMMYNEKFSFRLTKKNISIFVIILTILGYIVGGLYLARIELMGMDTTEYIFNMGGYTRKVPLDKSFSKYISERKDVLGGIPFTYLFAYTNIVQYETHGVFEFPDVMENINEKGDFFWGQATFCVYTKLVYKLLNSDYNLFEDIANHNSAPGLWSTFFFDWYLDFGWFGIILMFLIGNISKQIWSSVYDKCNILTLPLLLFMSMVWLMVLNLNQISSQGAYAIFSFVMLIIFGRNKNFLRDKMA